MISRTIPCRLAAIAVLVAAASLSSEVANAEPFVPSDEAYIVEQLPTPADGTTRELRALRQRLAADPEDLDLALALARRYIELGRRDFDPRPFGHAEAVLQSWWHRDKPPVEVLVLRATLRQNRHDFATALADLSAALDSDPRNLQARLTHAVILQVVGRHDEARRSCAQLALLALPLVAATCGSDVASVSGRATEAYALLRSLIDGSTDADPGVRQWATTVLAEVALRAGDPNAAELHFRSALALGVKDAYLLAAFADFLLDQGRAEEARELLADETRADPLLLRLALAEKQLGNPALAEHVASLQARFAAARLRGDTVHQREEARFALHLLGRPREALRLALANWAVQREAWDARLVLESALAAGTPETAAEVVAWLKQTRLEDPTIDQLIGRWTAAAS